MDFIWNWISGGKKNRQKERRLMKGFNLAPPNAAPGGLPPVAEFIASFQHSTDGGGHEYYGQNFSNLMNAGGVQPRRNHMYSMQQFSSSQSSFSESLGNFGKLGKLSSRLKNGESGGGQKRRWGKC